MDKIKVGTIGTVVKRVGGHEFIIGQRVKFRGYDGDGDMQWEELDSSDFWWTVDGEVEVDQ